MLRKERFDQPSSEGKTHLTSDIYSDKLMPKPCMFVNREGTHTIKQKLDIRSSLTMPEYLAASLALIRDQRACRSEDREHILAHIHDVTQDAIGRPWEAVRRWSQGVWDKVDRGILLWDDTQGIHNFKVSLALAGNGRQGHDSEHKSQRRECICRAFNTRAGCRNRSHHEDAHIRFMHLCSYCDSIGRQCTGHNVIDCDNKFRGTSARAPQFHTGHIQQGTGYNRPQAMEGPWRAASTNNQQFFSNQYQKNGQ